MKIASQKLKKNEGFGEKYLQKMKQQLNRIDQNSRTNDKENLEEH